eukprot:CAMPEP_0179895686 /NCGR_PEP_ID=MMETSP0982-20121206/35959_1 /TAXON_ID=483367 /ORGANISM="non described non described, Strain CCMP 2436" /LENGTH=319 /DNA_ID=CAMNT_0021792375 /DNA_START=55 /DNA_END=1011 /DNA_ORIENTATION=-
MPTGAGAGAAGSPLPQRGPRVATALGSCAARSWPAPPAPLFRRISDPLGSPPLAPTLAPTRRRVSLGGLPGAASAVARYELTNPIASLRLEGNGTGRVAVRQAEISFGSTAPRRSSWHSTPSGGRNSLLPNAKEAEVAAEPALGLRVIATLSALATGPSLRASQDETASEQATHNLSIARGRKSPPNLMPIPLAEGGACSGGPTPPPGDKPSIAIRPIFIRPGCIDERLDGAEFSRAEREGAAAFGLRMARSGASSPLPSLETHTGGGSPSLAPAHTLPNQQSSMGGRFGLPGAILLCMQLQPPASQPGNSGRIFPRVQ